MPIMDPIELRTQFQKFAGIATYRRFVRALLPVSKNKARLRYWQQKLWDEFAKTVPEASSAFLSPHAICNACEIHQCELDMTDSWSSTADVRDTREYAIAKEEGFPYSPPGQILCVECCEARDAWIKENSDICRILRHKTTCEEYAKKLFSSPYFSESTRSSIKQHLSEIRDEILPGDDLWEWDAGGWHTLSGSAGIAIVRNGMVAVKWCTTKS